MALTTETQTELYKVGVGLYDAALGTHYMNLLAGFLEVMTLDELYDALANDPSFQNLNFGFSAGSTSEQFATAFVDQLTGDTLSEENRDVAIQFVEDLIEVGGLSRGAAMKLAIDTLYNTSTDDPDWGDARDQLHNKVTVARDFTENVGGSSEDLAPLQGAIASVDETAASVVSALEANRATSLTATDGIDAIVGTSGDDVISGPIVQNQNGEVVNSVETGDSFDGLGGTDTMNADVTLMQGAGGILAPAVSATMSGVEIVNYRVQFPPVFDFLVNASNVDAELHAGVEQYWADNIRADLQIEDIRQLPEELVFGMRQTDPGDHYLVYFDPAQLAEDRGTAGDSSLTLTLIDNTPTAEPLELENFPVNGVVFRLGGELFNVGTEEALAGDSGTYQEFADNLQAALEDNPALAEVTVTLNANNTITLTDPAGRTFETGGYTWVGNVVPSSGELQWNQTVGAAVVTDDPVTTDVVLDAVGRTSQGGTLDIGSMADGGVEVFNVTVDRSSWLQHMTSREDFGFGGPGGFDGVDDMHLEIVNLISTGANGDLTIGNVTDFLDGRVASDDHLDGDPFDDAGLIDVRTVNAGGVFAGELNLAIAVTEDSIGRFLDPATGEVEFTYTGGAGADIFNMLVDNDVAEDPDFGMDVSMRGGDDRLILTVVGGDETSNQISVDGGLGNNVFATASSHGTTDENTFESFANFQTYEVEGDEEDTEHDFTDMPGVTAIVIATDGFADTDLIDTPSGASITISGRNQTLGNDSNDDQFFDDITISGADDETLRVTLENTARIDGVLRIDSLILDDASAANINRVDTLEIFSGGNRSTSNVINDVDANRVSEFVLLGTQDLDITISDAARLGAAAVESLVVNGEELTGDLDLTVFGAVINSSDGGGTTTVTLTGTAGTDDSLSIVDEVALAITVDTTVSGFETVNFGTGTDLGLWVGGDVDITNFSGVETYNILGIDADLNLTGLKGNEAINVNIDGDTVAGFGSLSFVAAGQAASNVLALSFVDIDDDNPDNPNDNTTDFSGDEILAQDFRTISMDLGGDDDVDEAYFFDLNLVDENGNNDAGVPAAYVPGDVFARNVVVTGGGDQGDTGADEGVDSVDLGTLTNVLSSIDLSDYVGQVTLEINSFPDADVDRNVTVTLNGYGANLTETLVGADENIVSYEFTVDAVEDTEDVVITGFAAFNAAGIDLTNLSILDLVDLGVEGLADLNIVDVGGVDTLITSNEGLDFEILLVGTAFGDLSNENFQFAT